MFFNPFSIVITSLWEERASLGSFRTFVRFVLVWICLLPLPLGVWEGLRFAIVALPWTFLLPFFSVTINHIQLLLLSKLIKSDSQPRKALVLIVCISNQQLESTCLPELFMYRI